MKISMRYFNIKGICHSTNIYLSFKFLKIRGISNVRWFSFCIYLIVLLVGLEFVQQIVTCSKSVIDTLEKDMGHVWELRFRYKNFVKIIHVVVMSLLLTLNIFHNFFLVFLFWLWTDKYWLGGLYICFRFQILFCL